MRWNVRRKCPNILFVKCLKMIMSKTIDIHKLEVESQLLNVTMTPLMLIEVQKLTITWDLILGISIMMCKIKDTGTLINGTMTLMLQRLFIDLKTLTVKVITILLLQDRFSKIQPDQYIKIMLLFQPLFKNMPPPKFNTKIKQILNR